MTPDLKNIPSTMLQVVAVHAELARQANDDDTRRLHLAARDDAIRRATYSHTHNAIGVAAGLSAGELAIVLQPDPRRPKRPTSSDPLLRDLSAAEGRILTTVDELFYAHGIRAVGVDQIVQEASVTKATFYKYFAGRRRLEATYAHFRHRRATEALIDAAAHASTPIEAIDAVAGVFASAVLAPAFRGDALMLAAAEFPDLDHPVRQVVNDHHAWERLWFTTLLDRADVHNPATAATQLQLAAAGLAAHAALAPAAPAVSAFTQTVRSIFLASRS